MCPIMDFFVFPAKHCKIDITLLVFFPQQKIEAWEYCIDPLSSQGVKAEITLGSTDSFLHSWLSPVWLWHLTSHEVVAGFSSWRKQSKFRQHLDLVSTLSWSPHVLPFTTHPQHSLRKSPPDVTDTSAPLKPQRPPLLTDLSSPLSSPCGRENCSGYGKCKALSGRREGFLGGFHKGHDTVCQV